MRGEKEGEEGEAGLAEWCRGMWVWVRGWSAGVVVERSGGGLGSVVSRVRLQVHMGGVLVVVTAWWWGRVCLCMCGGWGVRQVSGGDGVCGMM